MTNQVRILSMQPDGSDLQTSVLTPPAAHDGFYYAGSVPVFGEETVWSIAQLDYHSGMEPPPDYNTDPEAYENYDWDTYNADVQMEFYLCENAMDGTLLRYVPITGLEEYREDFTVYQMLWHPENGLLMLTGTGFILQIAEDGSLRELCEIPQRLDAVSSQGLVTGGDGTLYLWQTGTQPGDPLYVNELYPVDLAAGTVGEAIYSAESVSEAGRLKRRLDKSLDAFSDGLGTEDGAAFSAPPKQVKPGETVEILTLHTQGTVLSEADSKGEVLVQVGSMRTKTSISQLRLIAAAPQKKPKSAVQGSKGIRVASIPMSCDLRGMNLEEAIDAADRYLDDAYLSGLHEVTLVHGKGTGVLRSGIQQHLKKHAHVKSYRLGIYGEGEDGVTIVTLK